MSNNAVYDVIIIGAGPAGYSAAIYSRRANLKTLVIEKLSPGGQMGLTDQIDNYPGFPEGIKGFDLAMKMKQGADRFGAETVMAEVTSFELDGNIKKIITSQGEYLSHTVILALGSHPRLLGVSGEEEFTGKGVSYCATCDGMFYRGKTVAVIGGGNTAAGDAMYLSKICKKIYLIHRRDKLRASRSYFDAIENAENIEFIWNTVVEEFSGDNKLQNLKISNVKTGGSSLLEVDGAFVAVGNIPNSDLLKGQIELDDQGYSTADESTRTSIPGVFAVGDLRKKPLRQIVTATADGAVASQFAEEYISGT